MSIKKNVVGIIARIIWIYKRLTNHKDSLLEKRANKKFLTITNGGGGPKVTLDEIKEALTDPDVVESYKMYQNSSLPNVWGTWILDTISYRFDHLPEKDIIPLIKFLVNDFVTNESLRCPDLRYQGLEASIGDDIAIKMGRMSLKEKSDVADYLAINDFGRVILANSNPIYITKYLSKGLSPEEYDNILSRTGILADMPYERAKEFLCDHFTNNIAVIDLLRANPDNHEDLGLDESASEYTPMEKIIHDEAEKQMFLDRAREIVNITLSHCKKAEQEHKISTDADETFEKHRDETPEKYRKEHSPVKEKAFSYIDRNLLGNESVIYRTGLHWIIFLKPIISCLIAIAIVAAGNQSELISNFAQENSINLYYVAGLFLLIALFTALSPLIKSLTSEFGVTNKRVIVKVGFLRRTSLELFLKQIEGIVVEQSILERILGYGSIRVIGTGGTKEPFHDISAPLMFKKKVHEQIEEIQGQ